MFTSKRLLSGLLLAGLSACTPEKVEPELTLSASPRTIDGAMQASTIKVVGVDDNAKPGTGTVRVSSAAGSLKDGADVALVAGEGTVDFTCNRATDPGCNNVVRVTAEWVVSGETITANTNVTIAPAPDAGVDAGTQVTTLTSSRSRLGIGLGVGSDIVATYVVDGAPAAGASLSMTTTEGELVLPDGGAFASPATTDSTGQVRAVLREDGMAGTATITAAGPRGAQATAQVDIYVPDAGISITSARNVLTLGFNETSLLTVNHTLESRAVPGRPITLETTNGLLLELDGGTFMSPAQTDSNGQVRALLTDNGTPGIATITARDLSANVEASTMVTMAPPDAGVVVSTSRQAIYLGINDSTNVQATLYANGNPSANRALNVATSLGTLQLPDGGVFSGMGTTDSAGALRLVLRDDGNPGNATITATDPNSGRSGSASVSIRQISTINFAQMVCNGTPCTVLGINRSNFRTTARLQFVVRDNQTMPQPVGGVNVAFTINLSGATNTTISPAQAVTDPNGIAEVTVNTGNVVGSFTVTATVIPGVAATSPSFGVRGAKATNEGFLLQCNRTTMSAYTSALPPLDISANCVVTVNDRNGNKVGLPTDVSLRAEAGNIPSSVQTPEFTAATSASEGTAAVTFSTLGPFPAVPVSPLAADPTQFPIPRVTEPERMDGLVTRNPRDGLVVIIAWTRGEEWFNDLDGNGVQNGSEPFVDQGEPFLDTNDNDVFDGNDRIYDVDGDGVYTPPNGTWDSNTFVWTKTYVLYTDRAAASSFSPSTFNVARGASQVIAVRTPDLNLNRVEAGSTALVTRTAMKGSVTSDFMGLGLDDFGFDFRPRYLTNLAGTADCPNGTDTVCVYKTLFGNWSQGAIGTITVNGAPTSDMTPSETDNITVRTTTRGGTVTAGPITGTIQ
jgi:hypothetical protein